MPVRWTPREHKFGDVAELMRRKGVAPAGMSVLMVAYSLRTVACAPTRIHTIRCWSVLMGTVDVLPPRDAGKSLKLVAR